jgi:hypothetical protein
MSDAEPAINLTDYAYAASRAGGHHPSGLRRWSREWVLVTGHDLVLEVFESREGAVAELNDRFDADPTTVERMRLVVLDNGRVAREEWPRGGSATERAGALARHLSVNLTLGDDQVGDDVRAHYLRGEVGWTYIAGERRRSVELWWYTGDGEHDPVGLLVERFDEGAWQLLLDGRSRGLTETGLDARIQQVMEALGDDRWSHAAIDEVRCGMAVGRPAIESLGPAGVCVEAQLMLAAALHVTEPLGRMWP